MRRTIWKAVLIAGWTVLAAAGIHMTVWAGWKQDADGWHYYLSDGTKDSDSFRKSGDKYFYLDEQGDMAVSRLFEYDGNYYYVDATGARISGQWKRLPNGLYQHAGQGGDPSDGGYEDPYAWYYFQANGKAYRAPDSGTTVFRSIPISDGTVHQYAFDEYGRMLYGWVDENSSRQTGDDAWKTGVYYCGGPEDGARVSGAWAELDVSDDEAADDYGKCWFYFLSDGKKLCDATRVIDNRRYRFLEYGNAQFLWYTGNSASGPNAAYYNTSDKCWLASGWFKTVPPEEIDPEAYEAGEEFWFYGLSKGGVAVSQIRYIDGHRYGFNEKGEMLYGLYLIEMADDGKTIESCEAIEDARAFPDAGDTGDVYYFGDSPKEGMLATGKAAVEIDGTEYSFRFRSAGTDIGAGISGIEDGYIYIKGLQQKPEYEMRYGVIRYGGKDYLVSRSGKIQKSMKNVRDEDGCYYCSDENGCLTYAGYEKIERISP